MGLSPGIFHNINNVLLSFPYEKICKNGRVHSMLHRSTKAKSAGESRGSEGGDNLHEFLVRELPPGKTKQAPYLAQALREAGARYDRYSARRSEWLNYAARRSRLKTITSLLEELESCLCDLDIFSRDELTCRVDPKMIEAFVGSVRLLRKETTDLAKKTQENGRPRELAEERWILELADIYENAFGRPARVWGSGAGPTKRRGTFYHLLEFSRPETFSQHGKLSVR